MLNAESDHPPGGIDLDKMSLRAIRLQAGISLRSVAGQTGLDPTHLSRIERGEAQLSVDVLYRLSLVLHMEELARLLHPHISRRQRQAS